MGSLVALSTTVPRKVAWDYLHEPRAFPEWRAGMLEVFEANTAKWSEAGDRFRYAYRLLGRRVEGECVMDELKTGELSKFTATVPGFKPMHETWRYTPIGEDAFRVDIVQESEENTSFFGKAIDKMVLPRVVHRDLERSLDTLTEIFAAGLHE